jgi:hypothetical protein
MKEEKMSQETKTSHSEGNTNITDSSWKGLYRTGGVAALIAAVLFLSDIIVMTSLDAAPSTALGWFTLLQTNKITGILQLFFSDLIGLILLFPIILALYAALRRVNEAYSALGAALAFAGIAIVFATNTNYAMIYLSEQYAAVTTEVQRAQLLAAGELNLATATWGTGPLLASFLVEGALVIISVIMLQGSLFSKGIAYIGILAHGLDVARSVIFLICLPALNSDLALKIGVPFLAVGGTLQLIWYPLVGRRLLQLGHRTIPEGRVQ